jgi:hypothetical protein
MSFVQFTPAHQDDARRFMILIDAIEGYPRTLLPGDVGVRFGSRVRATEFVSESRTRAHRNVSGATIVEVDEAVRALIGQTRTITDGGVDHVVTVEFEAPGRSEVVTPPGLNRASVGDPPGWNVRPPRDGAPPDTTPLGGTPSTARAGGGSANR